MKAYNQETEQCWECYSCVKICPQQAIEIRGYADICPWAPPSSDARTDSIMWTIKFRNGIIKRFKFPIRTTVEGSIDLYGGKRRARRLRQAQAASRPRATTDGRASSRRTGRAPSERIRNRTHGIRDLYHV